MKSTKQTEATTTTTRFLLSFPSRVYYVCVSKITLHEKIQSATAISTSELLDKK